VAGVVGCMMAVVMGVDPADEDTLDRACHLGLAFQLANIARDVAEDAGVGRCYLPTDWLAEAGITPPDVMAPAHRRALATIVARLTTLAAGFEASARRGTAALDFRSAWAVLAAAKIYGDIGRKVAARGGGAWDARVTTSAVEKIGAVTLAGAQASARSWLYREPAPTPPPAWTRPRHAS
ncbi:MAG: hypothetical protein C0499_02215, partial [Zymomonas sp.]|nr:hypothetical protein [Zymomonas sp.]